MSKTSALAFAGIVLGTFLSVSAQAFPAASLDSKATSNIILVAEGCGPGFHRGWFGRCRPNEHVCQAGWHYSRFRGHCVRNWW